MVIKFRQVKYHSFQKISGLDRPTEKVYVIFIQVVQKRSPGAITSELLPSFKAGAGNFHFNTDLRNNIRGASDASWELSHDIFRCSGSITP